MNAGHELPPLDLDCQLAVALVADHLGSSGLCILRSFDLSTGACVPSPDAPCPHHGAVPCNSQLVVLLVYGVHGPPLSLVAHGYDDRTWFKVVGDPARPADTAIEQRVHLAIDRLRPGTSCCEALVTAHSQGEAIPRKEGWEGDVLR